MPKITIYEGPVHVLYDGQFIFNQEGKLKEALTSLFTGQAGAWEDDRDLGDVLGLGVAIGSAVAFSPEQRSERASIEVWGNMCRSMTAAGPVTVENFLLAYDQQMRNLWARLNALWRDLKIFIDENEVKKERAIQAFQTGHIGQGALIETETLNIRGRHAALENDHRIRVGSEIARQYDELFNQLFTIFKNFPLLFNYFIQRAEGFASYADAGILLPRQQAEFMISSDFPAGQALIEKRALTARIDQARGHIFTQLTTNPQFLTKMVQVLGQELSRFSAEALVIIACKSPIVAHALISYSVETRSLLSVERHYPLRHRLLGTMPVGNSTLLFHLFAQLSVSDDASSGVVHQPYFQQLLLACLTEAYSDRIADFCFAPETAEDPIFLAVHSRAAAGATREAIPEVRKRAIQNFRAYCKAEPFNPGLFSVANLSKLSLPALIQLVLIDYRIADVMFSADTLTAKVLTSEEFSVDHLLKLIANFPVQTNDQGKSKIPEDKKTMFNQLFQQILKHAPEKLERSSLLTEVAEERPAAGAVAAGEALAVAGTDRPGACQVLRAAFYSSGVNEALFDLLLRYPDEWSLLSGRAGDFREDRLGSRQLYNLIRLSSNPVGKLQIFCGHTSVFRYAQQSRESLQKHSGIVKFLLIQGHLPDLIYFLDFLNHDWAKAMLETTLYWNGKNLSEGCAEGDPLTFTVKDWMIFILTGQVGAATRKLGTFDRGTSPQAAFDIYYKVKITERAPLTDLMAWLFTTFYWDDAVFHQAFYETEAKLQDRMAGLCSLHPFLEDKIALTALSRPTRTCCNIRDKQPENYRTLVSKFLSKELERELSLDKIFLWRRQLCLGAIAIIKSLREAPDVADELERRRGVRMQDSMGLAKDAMGEMLGRLLIADVESADRPISLRIAHRGLFDFAMKTDEIRRALLGERLFNEVLFDVHGQFFSRRLRDYVLQDPTTEVAQRLLRGVPEYTTDFRGFAKRCDPTEMRNLFRHRVEASKLMDAFQGPDISALQNILPMVYRTLASAETINVHHLVKLFQANGAVYPGCEPILLEFQETILLRELICHASITSAHVQRNLSLFSPLLEYGEPSLESVRRAHYDFSFGAATYHGPRLTAKTLALFFDERWKIPPSVQLAVSAICRLKGEFVYQFIMMEEGEVFIRQNLPIVRRFLEEIAEHSGIRMTGDERELQRLLRIDDSEINQLICRNQAYILLVLRQNADFVFTPNQLQIMVAYISTSGHEYLKALLTPECRALWGGSKGLLAAMNDFGKRDLIPLFQKEGFLPAYTSYVTEQFREYKYSISQLNLIMEFLEAKGLEYVRTNFNADKFNHFWSLLSEHINILFTFPREEGRLNKFFASPEFEAYFLNKVSAYPASPALVDALLRKMTAPVVPEIRKEIHSVSRVSGETAAAADDPEVVRQVRDYRESVLQYLRYIEAMKRLEVVVLDKLRARLQELFERFPQNSNKIVALFLSHSFVRLQLFSQLPLERLKTLFIVEERGEAVRSRFVADPEDRDLLTCLDRFVTDPTALPGHDYPFPEHPPVLSFLAQAERAAEWDGFLRKHKYELLQYATFVYYLISSEQRELSFELADLYRIMISATFRLGQAFRGVGIKDEGGVIVDPIQAWLIARLEVDANDPGGILRAWLRRNGVFGQREEVVLSPAERVRDPKEDGLRLLGRIRALHSAAEINYQALLKKLLVFERVHSYAEYHTFQAGLTIEAEIRREIERVAIILVEKKETAAERERKVNAAVQETRGKCELLLDIVVSALHGNMPVLAMTRLFTLLHTAPFLLTTDRVPPALLLSHDVIVEHLIGLLGRDAIQHGHHEALSAGGGGGAEAATSSGLMLMPVLADYFRNSVQTLGDAIIPIQEKNLARVNFYLFAYNYLLWEGDPAGKLLEAIRLSPDLIFAIDCFKLITKGTLSVKNLMSLVSGDDPNPLLAGCLLGCREFISHSDCTDEIVRALIEMSKDLPMTKQFLCHMRDHQWRKDWEFIEEDEAEVHEEGAAAASAAGGASPERSSRRGGLPSPMRREDCDRLRREAVRSISRRGLFRDSLDRSRSDGEESAAGARSTRSLSPSSDGR